MLHCSLDDCVDVLLLCLIIDLVDGVVFVGEMAEVVGTIFFLILGGEIVVIVVVVVVKHFPRGWSFTADDAMSISSFIAAGTIGDDATHGCE